MRWLLQRLLSVSCDRTSNSDEEDKMDQPDPSHSDGDRRLDGVPDAVLPDRRMTDRQRSICRIARVEQESGAGIWRVENISNEGVLLVSTAPMVVGETIRMALSESVNLVGRIVWSDAGRCGVALSRPMDAAAVLRTLAAEHRAERHRAFGPSAGVEAILALPEGAKPIDLHNISQMGAHFVYGGILEPEMELKLLLPGDDIARSAFVRWVFGNRGGVWFTRSLELSLLERLNHLRD